MYSCLWLYHDSIFTFALPIASSFIHLIVKEITIMKVVFLSFLRYKNKNNVSSGKRSNDLLGYQV